MRSNSKVRRAAMAALVAAAVVVGAGQASAEVRILPVDYGRYDHSIGQVRKLKRPVRGATSLQSSLQILFARMWDPDGDLIRVGAGQRMPVLRQPQSN